MPKCSLVLSLSTTVCLSCVTSDAAAVDKSPVLPLKTLRIYEGGVGYFERTGRLSSSTATTLPVPASHLDDALKTLVILNQKGAGIVHGLEFHSLLSQGMARAQAGLPLDANVRSTYRTLLESFALSGAAPNPGMVCSGRGCDPQRTGEMRAVGEGIGRASLRSSIQVFR